METLENGMIYVLGWMEQEGMRFPDYATQKSEQFKTYELFIFGIFHLIFLSHDWQQITETMESETMDKGVRNYYHSVKSNAPRSIS